LGDPAWAADPALATAADRRAAHDRIDAALAAWCASQDLEELVARLLAAGIPAAPVVAGRYAERHPQLQARGFFETVTHPVAGRQTLPGLPMRFSSRPGSWFERAAPTLGQHTAAVLREWLALDDTTLASLTASAIIGERPLGA
jgi:crotonobetainyl-CoA:carnitine CoA-transferase CaiB-like acyl-CoA transferase